MCEIAFFSSPIGLGHATRDSAIIDNLENSSYKFFTGNAATKFFKQCGYNVEDVYQPPKFDVEKGLLKNQLKWLWKYYKYYKNCKEISKEIILKNKPKIIISDEDFASIAVAQELGIPNILVTDILETRFTKGFGSIIEKKMNSTMREIIKKCDKIIIPENGKNEKNIIRTGPIVRHITNTREELRKKFGFSKKTITLSVGGTDAGKFLIKQTIEVLKNNDEVELVIVSGPNLQENTEKNIKSLGFVTNLHEIIHASDAVISLAGKSTIDESITYGTPGIFIPIKDHFEQEDNAKELGYSFDDIFRLEQLIREKLKENRNPIKSYGAINASSAIELVLSGNSQ